MEIVKLEEFMTMKNKFERNVSLTPLEVKSFPPPINLFDSLL